MLSKYLGCLLGGAVGDALGWPVEFLSREQILSRFGHHGIEDPIANSLDVYEISDDTQMSLFTAEGLLISLSMLHGKSKNTFEPIPEIYHAYLRWLYTQTKQKITDEDLYYGQLIEDPRMYYQRAPGNSCLSALRSGRMGTMESPINNSKGCGGVMRVGLIGLMPEKTNPFVLGCRAAAITHGHPTGFLAAGTFALIIRKLLDGSGLRQAVEDAISGVSCYQGHDETSELLSLAMSLSTGCGSPIECITRIGEGWTAAEALAIAVFCTLREPNDFAEAVRLSVNHDGDSDSTGCITGSIMGAYLGVSVIPAAWLKRLELRDVIVSMAEKLFQENRFSELLP